LAQAAVVCRIVVALQSVGCVATQQPGMPAKTNTPCVTSPDPLPASPWLPKKKTKTVADALVAKKQPQQRRTSEVRGAVRSPAPLLPFGLKSPFYKVAAGIAIVFIIIIIILFSFDILMIIIIIIIRNPLFLIDFWLENHEVGPTIMICCLKVIII